MKRSASSIEFIENTPNSHIEDAARLVLPTGCEVFVTYRQWNITLNAYGKRS